ncbi:MAG: WecB/TagA/CpsF family glycosyltransferase [Bacteroidetes bacterium]|nr:WecB/TagA/CpsF family glycosyltransferase [Bacteroidota bacterium]
MNDINSSSCKVIIIGMGVPRQELLAFNISKRAKVILIICVGNFLEFYFGTKKRIPKIFRNTGVEWLYRLISEPRRLWKRYLVGIPIFLFRILKLRIKTDSIETVK